MANYPCYDCERETIDPDDPKHFYMVKHELWKIHGVGKGYLCWDCFEKRLGRELDPDDMLDCPLNNELNPYVSQFMERDKYN